MPLSVTNGMASNSPVTQLNRTALIELPNASAIGFHMAHNCPMAKNRNRKYPKMHQTGDIRACVAAAKVAGNNSVAKRMAW